MATGGAVEHFSDAHLRQGLGLTMPGRAGMRPHQRDRGEPENGFKANIRLRLQRSDDRSQGVFATTFRQRSDQP